MYNEHSVCEREINDLNEEVRYYKMLFYKEGNRRIRELFELAEMMDDETSNALRDLMNMYSDRLDRLNKVENETLTQYDKNICEALQRQCRIMIAELFQTMKQLHVLDDEEKEIGGIKKRECLNK